VPVGETEPSTRKDGRWRKALTTEVRTKKSICFFFLIFKNFHTSSARSMNRML
jgi:hypothetical protein